MKSLSVIQPWATLIATGAKRIETRSWAPPESVIGERLAIHASKSFPVGCRDLCAQLRFFRALKPFIAEPLAKAEAMLRLPVTSAAYARIGRRVVGEALPLGCVIATAKLVAALPILDNADGIDRGVRHVSIDDDGDVLAWSLGYDAVVTAYWVGNHVGDKNEAAFGDYSPGRWAWLLDEVEQLPEPVPAKGSLGLWEWQP